MMRMMLYASQRNMPLAVSLSVGMRTEDGPDSALRLGDERHGLATTHAAPTMGSRLHSSA